jgi:DNA mismatch repair ATPase MutL
MDQHAAHERVNFEKFRRALETGGVPCQRLLMPINLQTTPRDADLLKQNQAVLSRLGIEIEPFGPNIFKVEALPAFLKTDDPPAWLDQVIEELSSLSAKSSSLRLSEDAIATTACRASVKSNDAALPSRVASTCSRTCWPAKCPTAARMAAPRLCKSPPPNWNANSAAARRGRGLRGRFEIS